jgi:D-aminoacyl-tRNA deacylase
MRVVIQRVQHASVTIDSQVHSRIGHGLLVLAAFEASDTHEDFEWTSGKISRLRIFNDDHGVMNLSVQDVSGDILVVSQFTLFASTKKGNRPSYSRSAGPDAAIPSYTAFIRSLSREFGKPVKTGEFGADMKVDLLNDGPVTIIIDSRDKE